MSEQRCLAIAACVLGLLAGALCAPARSQGAEPDELGDPMRPSGLQAAPADAGSPAKEPAAALRLQAIKQEGRHRLAVINGQVVRAGDEIGGARVMAISSGSVVVNMEGKSSVVKLLGEDIKHDARAKH